MQDGLETKWSSGQITFHDGSTLKGVVRFNEVSKMISFKETPDAKDSRTFKETKVFSLRLVDSTGNKRSFYSFELRVDEEKEVLLFEVLREFKDWAVLGRKEMVQAIEGKSDDRNNEGLPMGKNTRAVLTQIESIYAIDRNGNVELIQNTNRMETDGLMGDYSKNKNDINKETLQKYMKEHYSDVESFVKKNKLKLKRKDDLLKALDYYGALVSKS